MRAFACYKYQAAGNDFVLIDNRDGTSAPRKEQIGTLCDRRFGIGADGVIMLEKDSLLDFRMVYHNRDGSQSFCGNGCRAIVHLANQLGVINKTTTFAAHDGPHEAHILPDGNIRVSLLDVKSVERKTESDFFVNTGTEHHVRIVTGLKDYPVFTEGRKVRYSDMYRPHGTNVDFVEHVDEKVMFRIYERGVEEETWSSGSGATACALVAAQQFGLPSPIRLEAPGGTLTVEFKGGKNEPFTNVYFTGPVKQVFATEIRF